jgi:hypothetical protein
MTQKKTSADYTDYTDYAIDRGRQRNLHAQLGVVS